LEINRRDWPTSKNAVSAKNATTKEFGIEIILFHEGLFLESECIEYGGAVRTEYFYCASQFLLLNKMMRLELE